MPRRNNAGEACRGDKGLGGRLGYGRRRGRGHRRGKSSYVRGVTGLRITGYLVRRGGGREGERKGGREMRREVVGQTGDWFAAGNRNVLELFDLSVSAEVNVRGDRSLTTITTPTWS